MDINPTSRRSSIFNLDILEYEDELEKELNFPAEYQQCLEKEKNDWLATLQALRDERKELKSKVNEHKDLSIKVEMSSKDLEFFDQALYYDCLRSVQHVCTKFECLMNKKEQQEFINKKNENRLVKDL